MATKGDIADMATKADVRTVVHEELAPVRSELKSIREDLDDLAEKVENVIVSIGYRKEIDHALERIAAIEKYLGLDKKIAAWPTQFSASPPTAPPPQPNRATARLMCSVENKQ